MDHDSFSLRVGARKIELVEPGTITPEIKVCLWNLVHSFGLNENRSTDRFSGARQHIASATSALASKPNPEFRNCIEESIHAVESALKIASGVTTGGIKDVLRRFCTDHAIHPALERSISSLYGFSSDKQGLRHPLLDEQDSLTGPDARMMLITASALVNWIVAKDAGLAT